MSVPKERIAPTPLEALELIACGNEREAKQIAATAIAEAGDLEAVLYRARHYFEMHPDKEPERSILRQINEVLREPARKR